FDADYLLKKIANNVVKPEINDFYTYRDLVVQSAKEEMRTCSGTVEPKETLSRFWFYPANTSFSKSEDGVYIVKSCDVKLLTEKQYLDKSKKEIISLTGESDETAGKFVSSFTDRYSDLCDSYFVYRRLRAIFKLYALAKFMVDEQVPVDIDYLLNDYKIKETDCPKTVDGVRVKDEFQHVWQDEKYKHTCIHRHELSGGVSMDIKVEPKNVLQINRDESSKIKTEVLKQAAPQTTTVNKTDYFLREGTYPTEDIRNAIHMNKVGISFNPIKSDAEKINLCGDTIEMAVTNRTSQIQKYKVQSGTILKNASSFSQDALVFKLKGELTGEGRYIVSDTVEITPGQTKKYLLEVYSSGFKKKTPLAKSEFYISNKCLQYLNKIDFADAENYSVLSKQVALWTLSENVSSKNIKERFDIGDDEIGNARKFLTVNGFKKEAGLLK
ncbi:MAG: hypothetical protein Q7K21_06015, partial [Elusimicrobiota bacterium]|nr:hypothetical protein [Elusimicrobiota bacterium]